MTRCCVLCGRAQNSSFSIFSFPLSTQVCSAWIDVIRKVKPSFAIGIPILSRTTLKNGLCEDHFLKTEISSGKKSRLNKKAVPSRNIISKTNKYDLVAKEHNKKVSYLPENATKPLKNNDSAKSGDYEANHQDVELIFDSSLVSDSKHAIGGDRCCFLCGSKQEIELVSVLEENNALRNNKLIDFITNSLTIEDVVSLQNKWICTYCFQAVKEVECLKIELATKIKQLQDRYKNTKLFPDDFDTSCYLEINEESEFDLKNNSSSEYTTKQKIKTYESDDQFKSQSVLTNHKKVSKKISRKILPLNEHSCTKCGRNWTSPKDLILHKKTCSQSNYYCRYCSRLLTNKARLKIHLYKFHGIGELTKRTLKCKLCDKNYTAKAGLRYHEFTYHKIGNIYTCEICGKVFYYKMLYRSHKLYMHGKKTVVCEICGQMFFTVAKLNSHVNAIHRKVLSWSCKTCNMKFATSSSYRHHNHVKHGCSRFVCPQCGAQFKQNMLLKRHLWDHNIYSCLKCKVKFDHSNLLSEHMIKDHSINLSKKMKAKLGSFVKENVISSNVESDPKDNVIPNVVINDILITSSFENSVSQMFSTEINNEKSKNFDINERSEVLSCVEASEFENSLEIPNVVHQSIDQAILNDLSVTNTSDSSLPNNDNLPTLMTNLVSSSRPLTICEESITLSLPSSGIIDPIGTNSKEEPSTSVISIDLVLDDPSGNSGLVTNEVLDDCGLPEKTDDWQLPNPLEEPSHSPVLDCLEVGVLTNQDDTPMG